MKKHPLILIDFQSTVKLSKAEQKKINNWLQMASKVMGAMLGEGKIIHPAWLKGPRPFRVSLLVCGEGKIKNLNRTHRGKDKVTDVLSFPSFETLRKAPPKSEMIEGEIFLGDLAICHQRTHAQAKEFKISYWDEFIHLYFHGLIHLLGYDHEVSLKEEKIMQQWESFSLDLFSKAKKKGP